MKLDETCCHVSAALGDISFDLHRHAGSGTTPGIAELAHWHDWICQASVAHGNLVAACEDIIELGVSDERIAGMKKALALSQGNDTYVRREDRW